MYTVYKMIELLRFQRNELQKIAINVEQQTRRPLNQHLKPARGCLPMPIGFFVYILSIVAKLLSLNFLARVQHVH